MIHKKQKIIPKIAAPPTSQALPFSERKNANAKKAASIARNNAL